MRIRKLLQRLFPHWLYGTLPVLLIFDLIYLNDHSGSIDIALVVTNAVVPLVGPFFFLALSLIVGADRGYGEREE